MELIQQQILEIFEDGNYRAGVILFLRRSWNLVQQQMILEIFEASGVILFLRRRSWNFVQKQILVIFEDGNYQAGVILYND